MDVASFYIDHFPSESRIVVDFTIRNHQVEMIGNRMLHGNVVPLNEVRKAKWLASQILLDEDDPFTPLAG
jgi:hypothetical protein